MAAACGWPAQSDIGYPTPGSIGTWALETGRTVVTYELPEADSQSLIRDHSFLIADRLRGANLKGQSL